MITEPDEPKAYRPPSPILDTMPLLPGSDAGKIVDVADRPRLGRGEGTRDPQLIALAEYYFGDTAEQASSARFSAAIDRALEAARDSELEPVLQAAEEVHVVVGRLRSVGLLLGTERFGIRSTEEEPAHSTGERKADDGCGPQPARHPAHRVRLGLRNLDHAIDREQCHDDERQIPAHNPRVCVARGRRHNSPCVRWDPPPTEPAGVAQMGDRGDTLGWRDA